MPQIRATASAVIMAPPATVYRLIADYHRGHPRILPPRYFRNLQVEAGGTGAGTRIRYEMRAFGMVRTFRAEITEQIAKTIGRKVSIEGFPRTVIGVMPARFDFPEARTDVWMPLARFMVTENNARVLARAAVAEMTPAGSSTDDALYTRKPTATRGAAEEIVDRLAAGAVAVLVGSGD